VNGEKNTTIGCNVLLPNLLEKMQKDIILPFEKNTERIEMPIDEDFQSNVTSKIFPSQFKRHEKEIGLVCDNNLLRL
jgi:hypothetical protein